MMGDPFHGDASRYPIPYDAPKLDARSREPGLANLHSFEACRVVKYSKLLPSNKRD